ncbi:lipid-A-disaccharide synthase [Zavarzinella formosa]|uniref:lipid-A-disaccharide synthase n=1 Tax=Zavarzinella formosa TaxID=360055 RepID=UPI0003681443|nr:lipid-A-disaccharide synthase [Zavarzinella formosa]
MHVFMSAGEPSGDLHGANLIRAILAADPTAKIVGFGGEKMRAAGQDVHYPLAQHSVMWVFDVLKQIRFFRELLDKAHEYLKTHRPDVVVMIDYPGFHWKLAEQAKEEGIPVVYFVPPQIWAWRQGRVKKMKKLLTHVLSALPFEHDWFTRRGVPSTYIGHPYFDELASQKLDDAFMAVERAKPGRVVGILPGSRNSEIRKNAPEMLRAARKIHAANPNTRFMVAAFNDQQAEAVRELIAPWKMPAEVFVGRTPEIIELSECCISVSGSVSLEMMWRRKPAVVIYRLKRYEWRIGRHFKIVPFISLVNLLASEELYPEFLVASDPSKKVAARITEWLSNPEQIAAIKSRLTQLCNEVAKPGACELAAKFLIERYQVAKQPGPTFDRRL